jgi:hypothetical protein
MGKSLLFLRFPLILLAAANLYLLSQRLSPLQEIFNLPLNGAVAMDPAICLLVYIGFLFWLPRKQSVPMQQVLGEGILYGLIGGLILVVELQVKAMAADQDTTPPSLLTKGLLAAAVLFWGFSGLRSGKVTGNAGVGLLAGIWSAMVSSLLAATALVVRFYVAGPPPASADPWKQYQGLAIGNPATQALVLTLNSITFFLLVGPIVGGGAGLFLALFGQKEKA